MYQPGWNAKLVINGTRLAFSRGGWNFSVDNLRTTNSEGLGGVTPAQVPLGLIATNVGSHVSINGNGCLQINCTMASFDDGSGISLPGFAAPANPFAAPFTLIGGTFVRLQYFLAGIPGFFVLSPSFHVVTSSADTDTTGLSPISFSGESNGWTLATTGGIL